MAFYIVRMAHPDGPEWNRHVVVHVEYLLGLITENVSDVENRPGQ